MLRQRILTAMVLIPLVILGIFKLPTQWFAVVLGLVLLAGAWEWSRIAGLTTTLWRLCFVGVNAAIFYFVESVLHQDMREAMLLLYMVSLFWLVMLGHVIRFNLRSGVLPAGQTNAHRIYAMVSGCFILVGTFLGLVGLRDHMQYGPQLLLLLMVLIWAADSAAYFTGRAFGKHKLALHVSPGKSWEGVAGALVATVIIAGVVSLYAGYSWQTHMRIQLVAICTVLFSILGDLTESMFKRVAGVKDSSHILPGHGGIMDRIDSLTSGAPIFLLGLTLLGLP